MKKINTLNFSVSTKSNNRKHKGIIPIVFLIFLVGIISCVFIFTKNDFNIKKVIGLRDEESSTVEATTEEVTQSSVDFDFSDSVNFLTLCYDDSNDVSFAFVISFIPDESRIRIKPIDPDMKITVFTGETTFSEAFKSVNIDALIDGLEVKGILVNKYVLLSEDGFVSIIQKLGSVTIKLDAEFEYYSNSIKYVLPAGENELTSDALLAYMKFHGNGDSKLDFSSSGAKTIIETFFTEENVLKGETLFTELINCVSTDITAFDYVNAKSAIESLCKNGFSVTINL